MSLPVPSLPTAPRRWRTALVTTCLGLSLGFVLGFMSPRYLLFPSGRPSRDAGLSHAVRQGGYRYINPLLECEATDARDREELQPFQHHLEAFLDNRIEQGSIRHGAVYFRDLSTGAWFGVREQALFAPASLLKVPLMMAYLKRAESNPALLTNTLTFSIELEPATPLFPPSQVLQPGQSYTVEDLIRRMIAYSDNNAKNLLALSTEPRMLEQTYLDLGVAIPNVRGPSDFMTVKEYASFFRVLYNATYLNRAMSEKALGYLANAEFDRGLAAGVPQGIVVAGKFGERGVGQGLKQLHDCGIVYYPRRPYLLCVMTRGEAYDELLNAIADLSRLVYHRIDQAAQKNRLAATHP